MCLVIAGLGGVTASAASAATDAGLGFAQSESLAITWQSLEQGKQLAVCNGGTQFGKPLEPRLAGFDFKHTAAKGEDEPVVTEYAPGRVLSVTVPHTGIPAGACRPVSIGLKETDPVEVDAGPYSGSLALTAPGLGVAHLPLVVAGPGTVAKAAALKGAEEVAALDAENPSPWGSPHLVAGADLLLKLPATGEEPLEIGKGCKRFDNGTWTKKCPFIGNLYKGGDVIGVHVAGAVIESEGVARLPVRISGSHAVGDYEGVLDPSLTGEAEQGVKTKLTAKDAVCWPLGALLIGILLALLVQLWTGRWRPKHLLKWRKGRLVSSYVEACARFNDREISLGDGENLTITLKKGAVETYADGVKDAIGHYSWTTLLFDTESDAYKQIDNSLSTAEDDCKLLTAESGLEKAFVDLDGGIDGTVELLVKNHLTVTAPELLTRAKALLAERSFSVGDATARSKSATALTASLKAWRKLADRVLGDVAWLIALATGTAAGGTNPIRKDDEAILANLAVRLRVIHGELLSAGGDEDLERLRTSGRIESAHGQLVYLAAKYKVHKPIDEPVKLLDEAPPKSDVAELFNDAFEFGDVTADSLPADRGFVQSVPASPVQLPKQRFQLVLVDALVLAFAAAGAIFAGLTAFYFGKSFGTWQDYATLIVVGAVAQTVVKAILDNASAFWHDISPLSNLEIARAKVVPKKLA